ncbi:hypothetical protein XENOCAPTIV_020834, partial [Xenoophorus captivus]
NQPKAFAYDYCFWSMDESQKDKFAGLFILLCYTLLQPRLLLSHSYSLTPDTMFLDIWIYFWS